MSYFRKVEVLTTSMGFEMSGDVEVLAKVIGPGMLEIRGRAGEEELWREFTCHGDFLIEWAGPEKEKVE